MREVGYCRDRLKELCKIWQGTTEKTIGPPREENTPAKPVGEALDGLTSTFGQYVWPGGCRNAEAAVRNLLGGVSAEDLEQLDQRLQARIQAQFTALVSICLNSVSLKTFAGALHRETEAFLGDKGARQNVLDIFLTEAGAGPDASTRLGEEVGSALDMAKPDLASLVSPSRFARSTEVFLLSAPAERAGDGTMPRLRDLVRQAIPNQKLVVADPAEGTAANEILFYREELCLTLSDLKLLGPLGRETYRQLNSLEHFTPHTRIDITEWYPAVKQ
jgi:hypothetical protein